MIGIIDYGTGNVMSIFNMLSYLGIKSKIINQPREIKDVTKIILPGVGSFDNAMKEIKSKWIDDLNEHVLTKEKYILGICLGMQIMCKNSEEGILDGIGWLDANVIKFDDNLKVKVPHMGWNLINVVCRENILLNPEKDQKFYFVHSYYVSLNEKRTELCQTFYGINFTSGYQKNNIFGVQFHPEKSHKFGMRLLQNFSNI